MPAFTKKKKQNKKTDNGHYDGFIENFRFVCNYQIESAFS